MPLIQLPGGTSNKVRSENESLVFTIPADAAAELEVKEGESPEVSIDTDKRDINLSF